MNKEMLEILGIVVHSITSLVGIIFVAAWPLRKYEKIAEKERELQRGIITEKLQRSSRRFDDEMEMYKRLNTICAEVYDDICWLFPTRMRKFILEENSLNLDKIGSDVSKLEIEAFMDEPFLDKEVAMGFIKQC